LPKKKGPPLNELPPNKILFRGTPQIGGKFSPPNPNGFKNYKNSL
jgi:hypothetical protein